MPSCLELDSPCLHSTELQIEFRRTWIEFSRSWIEFRRNQTGPRRSQTSSPGFTMLFAWAHQRREGNEIASRSRASLFTPFVRAFRFALVAHLARLRFFFAGFV